MSDLSSSEYAGFLLEVKARIRRRQYKAFRAVNAELTGLYREIGESIHQKQQDLGWGKAVLETHARDLQAEFPGRNGFSARNLWNMREFYREYSTRPKLQPLVAEISWAKNLVILSRGRDDLEREFYLRATARFGWTKAVLQHQIDNKSYEKSITYGGIGRQLSKSGRDRSVLLPESERSGRPGRSAQGRSITNSPVRVPSGPSVW